MARGSRGFKAAPFPDPPTALGKSVSRPGVSGVTKGPQDPNVSRLERHIGGITTKNLTAGVEHGVKAGKSPFKLGNH